MPDEGYWIGGHFYFQIYISEDYNMAVISYSLIFICYLSLLVVILELPVKSVTSPVSSIIHYWNAPFLYYKIKENKRKLQLDGEKEDKQIKENMSF